MSWNPLEMPIHTTARGRVVNVLPLDPEGPTPEQREALARGRLPGVKRGMKGENNHQAKLDANKVRQIRWAHAAGARPTDLARRFGVDRRLISMVVQRHVWKHV